MTPKSALLCWALCLAGLVFFSPRAEAHELLVDQLRLVVSADGRAHAQLLLDPELTGYPAAREPGRVASFANDQVKLLLDSEEVDVQWTVRELFSRGGATSGDSLVTELPAAPGAPSLSVRLGSGLPGLVVVVQGEGGTRATFVDRGATTAPYSFQHPGESWRRGGAERFGRNGEVMRAVGGASRSFASGQSRSAGSETSATAVLLRFFTQGIVHIVPKGLDHVLFICALVLGIGTRLRRLVLLLSGFTVAHTLTLGLGALGFQPIPSAIVEVFIAMSIAWVGMQSAWSGSKGEVLTLGVLGFGLLHGMGFAGALSEIAVPKDFLLLSLLGFNLGVELGQLIVVAWAALVVDLVRRITVSHEEWMRAASFGIAACGLFWTAERVIFAFS